MTVPLPEAVIVRAAPGIEADAVRRPVEDGRAQAPVAAAPQLPRELSVDRSSTSGGRKPRRGSWSHQTMMTEDREGSPVKRMRVTTPDAYLGEPQRICDRLTLQLGVELLHQERG